MGESHFMSVVGSKTRIANPFYRCAGPNCGIVKGSTDHWWVIWTPFAEFNKPVLYLCPWDEEIANREGTLHVCGAHGRFERHQSGGHQGSAGVKAGHFHKECS